MKMFSVDDFTQIVFAAFGRVPSNEDLSTITFQWHRQALITGNPGFQYYAYGYTFPCGQVKTMNPAFTAICLARILKVI